MNIRWYLMASSFPDLNWAMLKITPDGQAEIFDMDGKLHRFESQKEAEFWLAEDEFIPFDSLDEEDEDDLLVNRTSIAPPDSSLNLKDLAPLMFKKHASKL